MQTQESAPTPLPFTTFGRFRLLERLGRGGMATVYLAEMQGMGGFTRKVALKLVHPHLQEEPRLIDLFISEARLGGFLSHPNIIQTLDFGAHNGRTYLAMEHIDGPSLERILRECHGRGELLPADIALEILLRVCHGLEYAHRAVDHQGRPLRLVHRDLKPGNILLSRFGEVKLGDFGIARAESNLLHTQHSGELKGSVHYMSPEQAWGRLAIDHRSDLFAMGLIAYELFSGRKLYDGQSPEMVLRQAQDAVVGPAIASLPRGVLQPELSRILARALAREPEHRLDSTTELIAGLEVLRDRLAVKSRLQAWMHAIGYGTPLAGSSGSFPMHAREREHSPDRSRGDMETEPAGAPSNRADVPAPPNTLTGTIELEDPSSIGEAAEGLPSPAAAARPFPAETILVVPPASSLGTSAGPDTIRPSSANRTRDMTGTSPPGSTSLLKQLLVGTAIVGAGLMAGALVIDLMRGPGPAALLPSGERAATGPARALRQEAPPDSAPTDSAPDTAGQGGATPLTTSSMPAPGHEPAADTVARPAADTHAPPDVRTVAQPAVDAHPSAEPPAPSTPAHTRPVPAGRAASPGKRGDAAHGGAPQPPIIPSGTGTLVLNARPPAEVHVDGASVGRTPVEGLRLAVGTHTVTFDIPDHETMSTTVTVDPDQTVRCLASIDGEPLRCKTDK